MGLTMSAPTARDTQSVRSPDRRMQIVLGVGSFLVGVLMPYAGVVVPAVLAVVVKEPRRLRITLVVIALVWLFLISLFARRQVFGLG